MTSSSMHLSTKLQKVDLNKVNIFVTNLLTEVVFIEISAYISRLLNVVVDSVIGLPIEQIIRVQPCFNNELSVVSVVKEIIDTN